MAKTKLHWSPRSPFVRKVMIAAHELGLQDQLELLPTKVLMKDPNVDYLPVNPLGKIPALILPSGEVLIDSGIICEYIDSLAGGNKLLPQAAESRCLALSLNAIIGGLLDILILWKNERDKPLDRQTPEWLYSFELKVNTCLAKLNKEHRPSTGAVISLVDISLGSLLWYIDFRFDDINWRTDYPALAAWYETFNQRPSVLATEIINND